MRTRGQPGGDRGGHGAEAEGAAAVGSRASLPVPAEARAVKAPRGTADRSQTPAGRAAGAVRSAPLGGARAAGRGLFRLVLRAAEVGARVVRAAEARAAGGRAVVGAAESGPVVAEAWHAAGGGGRDGRVHGDVYKRQIGCSTAVSGSASASRRNGRMPRSSRAFRQASLALATASLAASWPSASAAALLRRAVSSSPIAATRIAAAATAPKTQPVVSMVWPKPWPGSSIFRM